MKVSTLVMQDKHSSLQLGALGMELQYWFQSRTGFNAVLVWDTPAL